MNETMTEDKTAIVEVRDDDKLVARVRHDGDAVGSSIEIGSNFDSSVRLWFDSVRDNGDVMNNGRMVATVRGGLRKAVRNACEASIWESHTGDVSALCDGVNDDTGNAYIEAER